MANRRKRWVYPPKQPKPTVPAAAKADAEAKAQALVESVLRPRHIKPPPADERLGQIVDIGTR